MSLFARLARPSTMNGYNFTERVRRVLTFAREEASSRHHEYVGTEHILLGLVRERDGVASAVLDARHIDRDALQEAIEQGVQRGTAPHRAGPDLPYTSRAKKVLELAMAEARWLNHSYVGTEHLLLGLLAEEQGIAAQVLVHQFGLSLDAARQETLRLLGSEQPHQEAPPPPPPPAPDPFAMAREQIAWQRLTAALDVTARLGATPSLSLEDDGTLVVSVGPDLVVSVQLPADARLRRRDVPPPNATGS